MNETVLPVNGPNPYDVVIGNDVGAHLPGMLGPDVQRIAVVCPESLEQYVDPVLADVDAEVVLLEVPEGEEAKQAEIANACWEALGEAGFTRSDAIIGIGGGATTDLAGFVAATWLRGVKVVHVPTSLLGMVDAAVGGKTGINTEGGKNLVGAFHEPAGVLIDLDTLGTLEPEEFASGLAEVIKCGFIADPKILDIIEGLEGDFETSDPVLADLVRRAVQVKIDVVTDDFKETGGTREGHPGREALNYGHTLGHAIEKMQDYQIRHGEAVAIGCVFAAELASRSLGLDRSVVDRHRDLFSRVGLPTGFEGVPFSEVRSIMALDKKSRGSTLRFIGLEELARPVVISGPMDSHLEAAFASLAEID